MGDPTEPLDEADYRRLKHLLRALGDVVRLNMVRILSGCDEMTVTDLTQALLESGWHISQPLVSWHLTKLRLNGLVRTRRYGRQVYCSLDTAGYEYCLSKLKDLISAVDASLPAGSGTAQRESEDSHTVRQRT